MKSRVPDDRWFCREGGCNSERCNLLVRLCLTRLAIRDRVRGFIENLVEAQLDDALGARAINVLGLRMWRARHMGGEHVNCLVFWRSDDQPCRARG